MNYSAFPEMIVTLEQEAYKGQLCMINDKSRILLSHKTNKQNISTFVNKNLSSWTLERRQR
jgi:hypothetical protein